MFKRSLFFVSLLLSVPAFSQSAPTVRGEVVLPDNFIRVTIGQEAEIPPQGRRVKNDEEVKRLRGRVHTLETAVRQLQEEIYWIRYAAKTAPPTQTIVVPVKEERRENAWYCSLTSNFNKTYSGKGNTKVEASANALNSCQSGDGGIFCKEENVQCEKAE